MNMYVTLSSTCFGPLHAHLQEEQLHKHSIWYPRSTRRLHTTPVESGLYDARSEKHHTIICKVDMYLHHYHTTHCNRYGIPECTRI